MAVNDVVILCYHKNASALYPKEWIDQYRQSILTQTYKGIDILEINYGGDSFRIFDNSDFEPRSFPTFIDALNYLLLKCFALEYKYIANTNVDDIFSANRIEKQVPFIDSGFDIVSSNFFRVYEGLNYGRSGVHYFDQCNIKDELSRDHNVVGHPGVMYSRHFIEHNRYIPEEQPTEDLKLWQRTIDNFKFKILPETLFTHRVHDNAVCRSQNK